MPVVLGGGVALASVGAIVPGWTLVIGNTHETSVARLDRVARKSLFATAEQVRRTLARTSSDRVYIFEHGAHCSSSKAACTTAHVHLHVVPLQMDLVAHADRRFLLPHSWSGITTDGLDRLRQCDYLLASSSEGDIRVKQLVEPVSQYFRRVVADAVGRADEWNWREWPQDQHTSETQALLARLFAEEGDTAA